MTERSHRGLVDKESFDFLIIFNPVELLDVDINVCPHPGLLELVQVVPQLLQIIGNVKTKVEVVGFYVHIAHWIDVIQITKEGRFLPALSLIFFKVSASFI